MRGAFTQPVRKAVAEGSFLLRRLRGFRSSKFPILTYHSIDPENATDAETISPSEFERQMRWLCEQGFSVLGVSELVRRMATGTSRPTVGLTFDDGYLDNYVHALPILSRLHIRATVYVVGAYVGRSSSFNPDGGLGDRPLMQKEHLSALCDAGVEVGSHSHTHRDLRQLSESELAEDLTRSRETLEQVLGRPVTGLAAPGGRSTSSIARVAAQCGYTHLVEGGRFVANAPGANPFRLRRIMVARTDSLREFSKKVAGAYEWLAWWDRD